MEKLKQYVKERDKMLLKRDVNELEKFVKEHKSTFEPAFVYAFLNSPEETKEITLHKMIVNCINLPFNFRQESADWLLDRGYRLDIGE